MCSGKGNLGKISSSSECFSAVIPRSLLRGASLDVRGRENFGLTRAREDRPGYPVKSKTSELGKSMRGQTRWSPVLVQRAVSEDPRWTRAVGDHLARPQGRRLKSGGRRRAQLGIHQVSPSAPSRSSLLFVWSIWFLWLFWFVWFFWFKQRDQQDRPNRPEKPVHPAPCCNRKRRGSRPNEWRPDFPHSSTSSHHVLRVLRWNLSCPPPVLRREEGWRWRSWSRRAKARRGLPPSQWT